MTRQQQVFVNTVWEYYRQHGRHDLPWRKTTKPYNVLVSEMMLQQTQVVRVLPKYKAFMKAYPTAKSLSQASLADVLRLWQGLGYNRRAKLLLQCASYVTNQLRGRWPQDRADLEALPGVGPYTAGAVLAFAYNQATPIIETNIRSVYLHHFFKDQTDVTDQQILELAAQTLDADNPREWYWALMDYGVYIKATHGNPNSRAKQYTKQSTFAGSDRQIRGAIIRALGNQKNTRIQLHKLLSGFEDVRIDAQLERLGGEGMVLKRGAYFTLPE